jgi:hypothetical protein
MREFLIRGDDDEEFDIPHSKWSDVMRPKSYVSKVIEGWGALRLEVAGSEVSFLQNLLGSKSSSRAVTSHLKSATE